MKAAIYCRLSDEDRDKRHPSDESESIQNQKTMLVEFALQQEWEIYGIYSDDDYTGADRSRPAFNNLLVDAQDRKFDVVLCKTQSRFTREMEYVEKYIHMLFPQWGVRFVSVVDHADSAVKGNKKARQINGLINEWYLEDLSDNIKSVLTTRRKNGLHIGAFSLYGYKKDPNRKGHLIVDEEAATVVREVFCLYVRGCGKTSIARMLNERGIPSPAEYKRLKDQRYRLPATKTGVLWRYSAISKMLTNEMYIGNMVQGRYASDSYKTQQNKPQPKENWIRVDDTHEPIITRELWAQAQELIEAGAKPFAAGSIGLFAHKVNCMNCGTAMRSSKTRDSYYLRCASHSVCPQVCFGAFISVRLLEETVCGELRKLTDEYLNKDEAMRCIHSEIDSGGCRNTILADIRAFEKRKSETGNAIESLYLDKVKGILTENEFSEMLKKFRRDNARFDAMLGDVRSQLSQFDDRGGASKARIEHMETYTDVSHLTREMVDVFIERIYVGKKDPITKAVPVEIHWNF